MTQDTLATADDTELGQLRRACASYVEVLAARDEEIERLRELVQLLTRFRPDAELARRDAEIKRLRGMLRDVDDGLDDYWVTTKEGVAWICRRHEALDE